MIEEEEEEEEEEEANWFNRWEDELPTPDELMPLSQSLITPDLALAFDITSPNPSSAPPVLLLPNHHQSLLPAPSDFDSPENSSPAAAAAAAGDEPARTLKRPRLVWTPQLHKRFVDAVAHLGIKNAVPKTIMQLMSVDGLTRENVASHLQKYRLYLKRMQGLSSSSAAAAAMPLSAADAATEQLFASHPIHNPFLARAAGPGQEPFMQFMAPPPLLQHHQQMAAQQQFYRQRQMGHFGYDNGFQRMGGPSASAAAAPDSYEDIDSGSGGGRRVLTLFPSSSED